MAAPSFAAATTPYFNWSPDDAWQINICHKSGVSACYDLGWVRVEPQSGSGNSETFKVIVTDTATDNVSPRVYFHNPDGTFRYFGDPDGNGGNSGIYTVTWSQIGIGGYGWKDWWATWSSGSTKSEHWPDH